MLDVGSPGGPFKIWDRRMWLMAIPIAAIVVATFWSVMRNDFVDWDDLKNFVNNPYYRGLGWTQLRWAWTTFLLGVYQPIAWMLLEVQYSLFALNPRGYHLVSVLLHAVNSVVLYVLTIALIGRAQGELLEHHPWKCFVSAATAAILFAVHPLRTEVVAWVSCQPYLTCALCYLLAIASYLRSNPPDHAQDRRWFWVAYAFFIAGLLSKAVAVSLPFVLLILDAYPLKRLSGGPWRWFAPPTRRVWFEKLPFIGASLVFMVVAMRADQYERTLIPVEAAGMSWGHIAQALSGLGFYVVKTLVPIRIAAYYVRPVEVGWLRPEYFLYMLTTLAIGGAVFRLRRFFPAAVAAWVTYLIILSPNLGLVRVRNQIAADRYSYLSLMALFALGAGSLAWYWSRQRLPRVVAVSLVSTMTVALVVSVGLTQIQAGTWRSSIALWTHAVQEGQGGSAEVQNLLGLAFAQESRREEAKVHLSEALRLNSRYAEARNNLGMVLAEEGSLSEAAEQFSEALRLNPKHVQAHNNMGLIFLSQRRVERAIREYATALKLEPDNINARQSLKRLLSTSPPADSRLAERAEIVLRAPNDLSAQEALDAALKRYD